ncbi:hypothetical protein H8E88_22755 [candidate division KSB1 bacterium]|nr:hypothetical protein [candidate division KSB1 bacterium]
MYKIIMLFLLMIFTVFSCIEQEDQKFIKKYDHDTDGMLLINGKRTFIIGTYHLPKSKNPYQELKDAGFNYLRVSANKEQLDLALKHDLRAWITLGSINPDKVDETSTRITENVRKYKDHPALLCWETVDEPAFTWNSAELRVKPEPLIETYNLIKEEDNEHLVYMNHAPLNLVSTMQKYNPGNDIVACDVYPVIPHGIRPSYAIFPDGLQGDLLNPYISQVGEYVDKMRRVAGAGEPLFMVLQGFAWEMLRKENDRDAKMIKYPTYEESRFMAYNAIIHGATGIIYWGTAYTPQPSPFWSNLKKVTRELGAMQNVLTAQNVNLEIEKAYHELGHSVDSGIEILLKVHNNKTYLITANADKNPIKITFKSLKNYTKGKVLLENRTIQIEDGEMTDTYKPFDVHIYELY